MTNAKWPELRATLLVCAAALIGGGIWEALGLPLGWLMGAAIATGIFAMRNVTVVLPKPIYVVSLASLGASVGLAITPEVAWVMITWAPVMVFAALLGISLAVFAAPFLARFGRMTLSSAFFSLLPGGVVEMANVGEGHGADRTIVASLHAVRVALVVGLLPLGLFAFGHREPMQVQEVASLNGSVLVLTVALGIFGGWIGTRLGLPAAWLLGALIAVGLASSMGVIVGQMPDAPLAVVQVIVGISLGARFQRAQLSRIPAALAAGLPVLVCITGAMTAIAALASLAMPFPLATLVLCFSIGGMAEMVLTSKALGQGVALVAAFQAVRGVIVNACAGLVWRRVLAPRAHLT